MIRTPTGLTAIMYPALVSANFVDVLDVNRVEFWVPAFVRLSGPFSITRAGIAYLTTVKTGDIQNSENDIPVLNQ
jgi:hypothetical protein